MERTQGNAARRICIALAAVAQLTLVGAAPRPDGEVERGARNSRSSEWERIEAAQGAMLLNGTLRHGYSLAGSRLTAQLGLRLELEHRIDTDEAGEACSKWRVIGLQTSLVPAGRTHLRWQLPDGRFVQFESARIGRALSEAGAERWLIRRLGPEEFEIRSLDGRVWRYVQGQLAALEHPRFGTFCVSTQGAWITRIEQLGAPAGSTAVVQVKYADDGRLLALEFAGEKRLNLTWNEAGELSALDRADGSKVQWKYQTRLLSEIIEARKGCTVVRWKGNLGFGRGDSRWLAPVHLVTHGDDEYDYALTRRGYVLSRVETATGRKTVTLYNPGRRRLEQCTEGKCVVVLFRKGADGHGALDRIETGTGEVLERYDYDGAGVLSGLWRRGGERVKFSYDDYGRLIGVDEERIP